MDNYSPTNSAYGPTEIKKLKDINEISTNLNNIKLNNDFNINK